MRLVAALLAMSLATITAPPAYSRSQSCADTPVFFGHRPAHVPLGILLVKVDARHWHETGIVDIIEPDDGLRTTSRIRVEPLIDADCGVSRRMDEPSYMMGVLRRSPAGEIYFTAFEVRLPNPLQQLRKDSDSRIVDRAFLQAWPPNWTIR